MRGGTARRAPSRGTSPRTSTPGGTGRSLVPAAREHEAQLGPLLAQQRERLEQPLVVLVRPRPGRVEQERLALLVAGTEPLVVDPDGIDVHALRRQAEQLDRRAGGRTGSARSQRRVGAETRS